MYNKKILKQERKMNMKVILVNGSPHAHGCTYTALKEIATTLEKQGIETEIFQLGTKPIGGCIACNSCIKNGGKCFMNEDPVNEFVEKAKQADGFVFLYIMQQQVELLLHLWTELFMARVRFLLISQQQEL